MSNKVIMLDKDEQALNNNRKKNKKILLGTIGGVLVIIGVVVLLLVLFNKPVENTVSYETTKAVYAKNKINYSEDDYESDIIAVNNGGTAQSDAAKQMSNKNNKLLDNYNTMLTGNRIIDQQNNNSNNSNSNNSGDNPNKIDETAWINGLKEKLKTSKAWIDNNYGTEEANFYMQFDEGKSHCYWDEHCADIKSIINYIQTGEQNELRYYKTLSYEQLKNSLLYSAWNCQIFSTLSGSMNSGFNCFNSWYKNNNPVINNVYSVALEDCEEDISPYTSTIKGTITTDVGNFTVYSALVLDENNNTHFEYYDVV